MTAPAEQLRQQIFTRDPTNPAVLVGDGYGLSLTVTRGHLLLRDGLGRHRRERQLPRAQRTVRRIVILGHTGHLTLEAVRWCVDTGIALLQLDTDGTILLTAGKPGTNDARLRRAQAAAPASEVGIEIAHRLLGAKLDGQAAVLHQVLRAEAAATVIDQLAEQVRHGHDLVRCRDLEAQASNTYFGVWSATVSCRFAERDRDKVPNHWTGFRARSSPLHRAGRTPRTAADPVNALLNYSYALAEAEARLAAQAVGLDPGLGVIQTPTSATGTASPWICSSPCAPSSNATSCSSWPPGTSPPATFTRPGKAPAGCCHRSPTTWPGSSPPWPAPSLPTLRPWRICSLTAAPARSRCARR